MANGKLPSSELARIYHPHVTVYLTKEAAAAWNTLRMYSLEQGGPDIYPGGPISAYRTYAEQVRLYKLYQAGKGNLAARPGTSNHGWGKAVDLAEQSMRKAIDSWGHAAGWTWGEAPSEWWHVTFTGSFNRPDPGLDHRNPVLRAGSGGPLQAWAVQRLQRHLREHGHDVLIDGDYGASTKRAVQRFQEAHGLADKGKSTGVCGPKTWAELRRKSITTASHSAPSAGPDKGQSGSTPVALPRPVKAAHPTAISAKGVGFIKRFEGFSATRYDDGVGITTIGYGTTAADVNPLPHTITEPEAARLLRRKLDAKYTPAVVVAGRRAGIVWKQHELDALTSFAYNLGPGCFTASGFETLQRAIAAKDRKAISRALPLYSNPGDPRVHAGLQRRRAAEARIFLTGDYGS